MPGRAGLHIGPNPSSACIKMRIRRGRAPAYPGLAAPPSSRTNTLCWCGITHTDFPHLPSSPLSRIMVHRDGRSLATNGVVARRKVCRAVVGRIGTRHPEQSGSDSRVYADPRDSVPGRPLSLEPSISVFPASSCHCLVGKSVDPPKSRGKPVSIQMKMLPNGNRSSKR